MEKIIRKEELIQDYEAAEFIRKCNEFNRTHQVYATQYQPVTTDSGVLYTAIKFYEVIKKQPVKEEPVNVTTEMVI